jgi:hypothetical protein
MPLPLAHLDAAVIEEVSLDTWKDVFDFVGWPDSLMGRRASFTHENVLEAFQKDEPSDHLLQALETLHDLGTEAGRNAIVTAMSDRRVPLDTLPQNTGEREFALRLFIAQQSNASLADVFARAQMQLQEGGDQRRYNEFMGREPWSVVKLSAKAQMFKELILQYCRASDLGEHVEVRAFEDDGAYVFTVLRSHHVRKPLAVLPGRAARATIEFRPVHGDILRYEASLGRLRIAARAATMIEFYRRALGKVLFDDETFFEGAPVCNLQVLQEKGREALNAHDILSVGRIWMTECLWERGDRNLLHVRSSDCFRTMEELRLPLSEGTILQAKLKVQVIGKSTRPVTVNIRVPSRIEISQKSHERLIERVLDAIGIRNSAPSVRATDLWSLYPWRQPTHLWRALFGPEMDALVQNGVLAPIQLDSIPHPDHPGAGRVLEPHVLSDGQFYATSQMPEVSARSVTATDLDGLELSPEQLRIYLRSKLAITSGGTTWGGDELLDLGIIELGDYRLHTSYALRELIAGAGARIRAWANGIPSVVLLPSSTAKSLEIPHVVLNAAVPTRTQILPAAINACGLANAVPAIYVAPEGARLVVDTHLKKIWFDGVEIEGLQPDSQAFRFIEQLARTPALVSSDELSNDLSPGRLDGDTPARQAKSKANKLIREAMIKVGRNFEDIFPTAGTGYYRCAVPAYVQ